MPVLPTNLNTNEVKDRAGVEVEFLRFSAEGRVTEFAVNGEVPSLPHRLKVSHVENGTGFAVVRRSLARVDKAFVGKSGKVSTCSCYKVVVVPMGELDNLDIVKDVSAELDSFCASDGTSTTIKFDGSGTGSSALINGTQ